MVVLSKNASTVSFHFTVGFIVSPVDLLFGPAEGCYTHTLFLSYIYNILCVSLRGFFRFFEIPRASDFIDVVSLLYTVLLYKKIVRKCMCLLYARAWDTLFFSASNKKSILFRMTSWVFLLFLFSVLFFFFFDTLYVMFVTQASFPLVCSFYKEIGGYVCSKNLIRNAFYYIG